MKQKRTKKKAKGYAVWLSMEISSASKSSVNDLKLVPRGSEQARSITEKLMQKFNGFMTNQTRRLTTWHFSSLFQRVALVASQGGVEEWIITEYGRFLVTLMKLLRPKVGELEARQISDLVWAFGKLGPEIFNATGVFMEINILENDEPIDVSSFFDLLLDRAVQIKYGFNSKDISSLAYGVASLPACHHDLNSVGELLDVCVLKMDEFADREIACLAWSMSKLGLNTKLNVLKPLVSQAEARVGGFRPQGFSMLIGSLAKLDVSGCDTLMAKLLDEIKFKGGFKKFKHREIATLASGLAQLRYRPSEWIAGSIAQNTLDKLRSFRCGSVCILLRAFAVWGIEDSVLFSACRAKLVSSQKKMSIQDVVNSAWAFAILGVLDDEYMKFCVSYLEKVGVEAIKDSELRQFHQCTMELSLSGSAGSALSSIPYDLEGASKDAWIEAQSTYQPSDEVKEALSLLESTGVQVKERRWLGDSMFCTSTIDIAPDVRYVIEMAVPEDAFINAAASVGKDRWREKALAALGYFRILINMEEWSKLTTKEDKLGYIKTKL